MIKIETPRNEKTFGAYFYGTKGAPAVPFLDKRGKNEYDYAMIVHEIPPLFDERSRVLILGSFPSPKSRASGFYYGHPQNRFWRVLSAVLEEPFPQTIDEKKEMLLRRKIALWDVIERCDITGAGDNTIKNAVPNDFDTIEKKARIKVVFTTGRTATELYKKFTGKESRMLPSPSPANCATSIEKLIESYKEIIPYLEEEG